MKIIPLLPLIFILAPLTLLARLGETLDQSNHRYGAALDTSKIAPQCIEVKFEKDGIGITADFFQGKCVKIEFIKVHGKAITPPGEPPIYAEPEPGFSEAEVRQLLEQNREDATWDALPDLAEDRKSAYFSRSDRGIACWRFNRNLTISSPGRDAYEAAVKKVADDAAAKDAAKSTSGL